MERGTKEKILDMIEEMEEKNSQIEKYISSLSILSRKDILKEISQDIINNNPLLQEIIGIKGKIISGDNQEKINSDDDIIDNILGKIQENPHKKVFFLNEYLDLFQDQISEKDKEVILKSLRYEKNEEKLKEGMLSLANIFNLNL